MRRVVITGMGVLSPIGNDLESIASSLTMGRHGIVVQPEWGKIGQLGSLVAGEVQGISASNWPRKQTRSMGRVGLLALRATELAIADSGLDAGFIASGEVGLAYGSTHGSSSSQEEFCRTLFETQSFAGLGATGYLKFMSNTCAVNLAQTFGVRGRVISVCSACVSASQAIGFACEAIRSGAVNTMLAGGAEELHYVHAGVFDMLYAASSHYNDQPGQTPRPFDAARDGLVVGEGAGTLVLEERERALQRGARVHAEILGFGTNCDGTHVTAPSFEGMAGAMQLALRDARLAASDIEYINAHATATKVGDVVEARATRELFGDRVPISSTKGFTGHTLGACGAIEAAFCVVMMQRGFLAPTRNLEVVDTDCAGLDHIQSVRRSAVHIAMSNNFAFGGINTSLVLGT